MMSLSPANILRTVVRDWLLRVPPDFFTGDGTDRFEFGMWWSGPFIGYADKPGIIINWLLGLVVVGLLVWLLIWQRGLSKEFRKLRIAVGAVCVVSVAMLTSAALVGHLWAMRTGSGWIQIVQADGRGWVYLLLALLIPFSAVGSIAAFYLSRFRAAIAGVCLVIASLCVPTVLALHSWQLLAAVGNWNQFTAVANGLPWAMLVGALLVVILATLALFYYLRDEGAVMALARMSLFAVLLMVISGPKAWNLTLAIAAFLLILDVYLHDGRSIAAKIFLALFRAALVALVLLLLNRPFFQHIETGKPTPSVVAVMIDTTESMSVRDVNANAISSGDTRLQAAVDLFMARNQDLVKKLSAVHTLRFYTFDQTAKEIGEIPGPDEPVAANDRVASANKLKKSLAALEAKGTSTQVIPSTLTVIDKHKKDHLAGIIIESDARDTPTPAAQEAYSALSDYHVKVYPVGVGSDKQPRNITMQAADLRESAFKGDTVNVKATVRAVGYEPGHAIKVRLVNAVTKAPLMGPVVIDPQTNRAERKPAEKTITVADSNPVVVELLFEAEEIGTLKVNIEAVHQPGELYETDNIITKEISILDAKITVLFVEGYPRWEYRYIKNEMMRDKTVNISCWLTTADPNFAQEHTDLESRGEAAKYKFFPFSQFPNTMEQLMEVDVVLFGDVDPRFISTPQLKMLSEFVSKKGGGFGMVTGPQWSPRAYGAEVDAMLPITVVDSITGWPTQPLTEGFLPVLTKDGETSSIFRFFTDPAINEQYIKHDLKPLYWYRNGIVRKPGSTVLAEHPTDTGPDGQKAPLLVTGRYGAGRTLFSAYDDSWRWRFYTGESIFDTYWTEQLRFLARGRKRGQRHVIFGSEQKVYQLGDQVRVNLQVLDAELSQQLLNDVRIEVVDAKTNRTVRVEKMSNSKEQPDSFTVSFPAEREGNYIIRPTNPAIDAFVRDGDKKMEIMVPNLEFAEAAVDTGALQALAARTGGQSLSLEEARIKLPGLIPSLSETLTHGGDEKDRKYMFSDMPLVLGMLLFLLTAEWIIRKVCGMV